jgi:threonine dehydrogenase-like Zn-dependent dehydrogenase
MKGLWLENQQLQLKENLPLPTLREGESLVKVLRAGICNTDLELIRGYYPYQGVIGHEFMGIVEQGDQNLIGKRVVGEINAVCGHCYFCRTGLSNHCENRTVLGIVNRNGAFAEYVTLPDENLHLIPDQISDEEATFTEPLAAALQIQEQVKITPNHRVLVLGDGKLGQLVAQTLALTNCELLVVGRHSEKLKLLEARGIKTGFVDQLQVSSFDLAVECTGHNGGFAIARKVLRPRGILVLKSTYANRLTIDLSSIVVDEITIIGSRCGKFPKALQLLADQKVDVKPLISKIYPLGDGLKAFAQAQTKGILKVLLTMES